MYSVFTNLLVGCGGCCPITHHNAKVAVVHVCMYMRTAISIAIGNRYISAHVVHVCPRGVERTRARVPICVYKGLSREICALPTYPIAKTKNKKISTVTFCKASIPPKTLLLRFVLTQNNTACTEHRIQRSAHTERWTKKCLQVLLWLSESFGMHPKQTGCISASVIHQIYYNLVVHLCNTCAHMMAKHMHMYELPERSFCIRTVDNITRAFTLSAAYTYFARSLQSILYRFCAQH